MNERCRLAEALEPGGTERHREARAERAEAMGEELHRAPHDGADRERRGRHRRGPEEVLVPVHDLREPCELAPQEPPVLDARERLPQAPLEQGRRRVRAHERLPELVQEPRREQLRVQALERRRAVVRLP